MERPQKTPWEAVLGLVFPGESWLARLEAFRQTVAALDLHSRHLQPGEQPAAPLLPPTTPDGPWEVLSAVVVQPKDCSGHVTIRWEQDGHITTTFDGISPDHVDLEVRRLRKAMAAVLEIVRTGGRPADLTKGEKLIVLKAIVAAAARDGIPTGRLRRADAADYLDGMCGRPQPIRVAGRRIILPPPLGADHALDGPEAANRKAERLKQWIKDCLDTKSWTEARNLLTH